MTTNSVLSQTGFLHIDDFFVQFSPYSWGLLGISICIGLSVLGAAWGIFITGTSILGGGVKAPHIQTKNLIRLKMIELKIIDRFSSNKVLTVLSFASAKLQEVVGPDLYTRQNFYTGYSLFWGGITVGICNVACGLAVGVSGSSVALADAQDPNLPFWINCGFIGKSTDALLILVNIWKPAMNRFVNS
ncbi:hypothetical protein PCK2_000492 [Pneumocystis canis]|nr:hypothetical protein PCK2_000492 [Pneumocystis canis]